jgi:hypothetical protein
MVTNVDVVTSVVAVAGKPHLTAAVIPGQVQYCATASSCKVVQVDNTGVTVGGLPPVSTPTPPPPAPGLPGLGGNQNVPVPGLVGSAQTTFFHVRSVAPDQKTDASVGSVDALGLDIAVTQPGDAALGVPNATVEYILGEGHADGFSIASIPFQDLSASTGSLLGSAFGSGGFGGGSSSVTQITNQNGAHRAPSYILAGALRPPLAVLFFGWEASVLGAAAALVWARRRPVEEVDE